MWLMDWRQESRFQTDQEIAVTLLGDVETVFPGKIVNVSAKGLGLWTNRELTPGAALKIELADTMLLGEVIYCRPDGDGYSAGIALEQALYHTRNLAVLAERLLGSSTRLGAYDKDVTPL